MNGLIGTLAFVCLFHVVGGMAIGSTLRALLRRHPLSNSFFLIVWGVLFGGVPLTIGYSSLVPQGGIVFFGIELAALFGTILLVALIPDWFVGSFDSRALAPVVFGGIFLLVGVGIAVSSFASAPLTALIGGGVFGGVGALTLIWGVVRVFNGTADQ